MLRNHTDIIRGAKSVPKDTLLGQLVCALVALEKYKAKAKALEETVNEKNKTFRKAVSIRTAYLMKKVNNLQRDKHVLMKLKSLYVKTPPKKKEILNVKKVRARLSRVRRNIRARLVKGTSKMLQTTLESSHVQLVYQLKDKSMIPDETREVLREILGIPDSKIDAVFSGCKDIHRCAVAQCVANNLTFAVTLASKVCIVYRSTMYYICT